MGCQEEIKIYVHHFRCERDYRFSKATSWLGERRDSVAICGVDQAIDSVQGLTIPYQMGRDIKWVALGEINATRSGGE
jgi:hypothetical protein